MKKNLKTIFSSLLLISLILNSCKKEKDIVKFLTLSHTSINVSQDTGQEKVSLTANTTWQTYIDKSWLTISPVAGSENAEININHEKNPNASSREAKIIFSGLGIENDTITITQAPTPIPEIPSGLSAVFDAGSNTVVVSWDEADNATSYHVYYSTSKNGNYNLLSETSETSTSDNIRYRYYKVKALNGSIESEFSNPVNEISPPTGLSVVFNNTDNDVTISWDPVADASSYRVYYSNNVTTSYNLLAEVTGTSITDNNRHYYYKISTVINSNESEMSDFIIEIPPAPKNLSAYFNSSDNKVKISWDIVISAESYKVYSSDSPTGEYIFSEEVENAAYSDPNRNRYYKISASNRSGESGLRYGVSENGRDNQREPLVDVEGNSYKTVQIGDQVWMAENLRVTKTPDGNALPLVIANSAWESLTNENLAYCYFNNEPKNAISKNYGALYTWEAALACCPDGWHLPSYDEWCQLMAYVSENLLDGTVETALKSTSGWENYGQNATNDYGFNAYPAGGRQPIDGNFLHGFYGVGYNLYWWTSSGSDWYGGYKVMVVGSYFHNGNINAFNAEYKYGGFGVRYVKD